MKFKIGKSLFLLSVFALASCGATSTQDVSSIDTSSNSSSIDIGGEANVKNVVKYLNENKNYKISTLIENEETTSTHVSYYSENYYYSSLSSFGFAEDNNGIFRLDKFQDSLLSSELIKNSDGEKLTDLWSSNLFVSFQDLDLNNFTSEDSEAKVSNKQDKLFLLDMMEINRGVLTSIDQFNLSIDTSNHLVITVTANNYTYTSTVDYGEGISNSEVEAYLLNNSYYQTTEEEKYLQDSFAGDNYTRVLYDSTGKTVAGWEHFTPNYYYGEYTEETEEENNVVSSGYVCLKNFTSNGVTYNGMYYFFLTDQGVGLSLVTDDTSYTMNSFMNYPSNLLALSNLQYFEYLDSAGEYVTFNTQIAADFIENFQISKMFQGQTLVPTALAYKAYNEFSDDYSVIFTVNFTLDGKASYMEFEFSNFGTANIQQVDDAFGF